MIEFIDVSGYSDEDKNAKTLEEKEVREQWSNGNNALLTIHLVLFVDYEIESLLRHILKHWQNIEVFKTTGF